MALSKPKHRLWERILVLSWLVLILGLGISIYRRTAGELLGGGFAAAAIGVLGGVGTLACWAALGGRQTTTGSQVVRALSTRVGAFLLVIVCAGLGVYLALPGAVRKPFVVTCTPDDATVYVRGRGRVFPCGDAIFLSGDDVLVAYAAGYEPLPERWIEDLDRDGDQQIHLVLPPKEPWSCAATRSRELDASAIEAACPATTGETRYDRATAFTLHLSSPLVPVVGRRTLLASTEGGLGVSLQSSRPEVCPTVPRVAGDPASSQDLRLGDGCGEASEQAGAALDVQVTLCAGPHTPPPELRRLRLLLTTPDARGAHPVECSGP
jgi:hypothetical protein